MAWRFIPHRYEHERRPTGAVRFIYLGAGIEEPAELVDVAGLGRFTQEQLLRLEFVVVARQLAGEPPLGLRKVAARRGRLELAQGNRHDA